LKGRKEILKEKQKEISKRKGKERKKKYIDKNINMR
jgi:hypothetical protein